VAYDHARYTDGSIATPSPSGPVDTPLDGKKVEGAPEWIARSGATVRWNALSLSLQHSFVSETFSDALNTESSANGAIGEVPAYHVFDLTAGWEGGRFGLRAGVTNLANERYYTRRSTQYPGPGILPSDGRSVFIGVDVKLP
jgi:Fe(3+) dicitrate transport protein